MEKLNRASDVVISVEHLSKSYRLYPSHRERFKEALHPFRKRYHEEFWALRDVSFDLVRGRSVGILGRNGAGKSTLLQLIAGVLTPTSGKIMVAGKVSALLELGAGFNPELSGRENVALSSTLLGGPANELAQRIANVEGFADIGRFFDQPMKVYSSGMYARVAFANAIEVEPDVLIVDEILGVGDAKFQEKCYDRIRTLRAQGVAILFVSHSSEVIQRNCESAILLEQGKLVRQGGTDLVIAAYHDLLYGACQNDPRPRNGSMAAAPPPSDGDAEQPELTAFLADNHQSFHQFFQYYNVYERRIGNGAAEIVDFLVTADGKTRFDFLQGGEVLMVYLKVRFSQDISLPRIGWALVSPEGIVIAGSNTVSQNIALPPAGKHEVWVYAITIAPRLCGGDFFLNLGVGAYDGQSWTFFDNRRASVHLQVAPSQRASGFVEVPSACAVVRHPNAASAEV